MCKEDNSCITINMNCCKKEKSQIGEGLPVGTVISYMGTTAPSHYLVCDGSLLELAAYPYLAEQISREFGSASYFGGNGKTTFAVPDLRGEFLRGFGSHYGTSGKIGLHQEGTYNHQFIDCNNVSNTNALTLAIDADKLLPDDFNTVTENVDYYIKAQHRKMLKLNVDHRWEDDVPVYAEVQRPTNVAVLYCIRYEP